MEIDIAPLVEIAGRIGAVGDFCGIAQSANTGEARRILRFDQVELGNQASGGAASSVQPRLVFFVQQLAGSPLDCDIALVAVEDRQADRERRPSRVNGCRVVGVIRSDGELWELLDNRLAQLLLLSFVACSEGEEIRPPFCQVDYDGL